MQPHLQSGGQILPCILGSVALGELSDTIVEITKKLQKIGYLPYSLQLLICYFSLVMHVRKSTNTVSLESFLVTEGRDLSH